ncbi:MAG TPA: beta-galactosidase [Patescibacteria group bacterium]|nr:beta-galactosidase [Patescibacteria group bacterium]
MNNIKNKISAYKPHLKKAATHPPRMLARYWRRSWFTKLVVVLCGLFLLTLGTMYGIARWYMATEKNKPTEIGVSFIPAYAQSLGLDPQTTMDALINDLGVRRFRLVSYWDQLEPQKGQYDFSLLDWQFQKAEASHSKITLSLGLRQPRWPECHTPQWAIGEPTSQWEPQLNDYITAVVNRYKNSPSLESYQLENEYFLKGFGLCTNFDRDRLVAEYNLVKALDPHHTLIVARSQNALGISVGDPRPDELGMSIYKRVWDSAYTHRYLEYPFPAWYYGSVAGLQKIFTGKDTMIHELQAEAYAPNGKNVVDISLDEQNKSFDAQRFRDRVKFGKATGMKEMYLWGAEYWYYRYTILHDPSLWQVAGETFQPK